MTSSIDIIYIAIMMKLHSKYNRLCIISILFLKNYECITDIVSSSSIPPLQKNPFNPYVAWSLLTLICIFLKCLSEVILSHLNWKKKPNLKNQIIHSLYFGQKENWVYIQCHSIF